MYFNWNNMPHSVLWLESITSKLIAFTCWFVYYWKNKWVIVDLIKFTLKNKVYSCRSGGEQCIVHVKKLEYEVLWLILWLFNVSFLQLSGFEGSRSNQAAELLQSVHLMRFSFFIFWYKMSALWKGKVSIFLVTEMLNDKRCTSWT